jgi:hypothetical protein
MRKIKLLFFLAFLAFGMMGCDVGKKSIRRPHESAPENSGAQGSVTDESSLETSALDEPSTSGSLKERFAQIKSLYERVSVEKLLARQDIKNFVYGFLADFNKEYQGFFTSSNFSSMSAKQRGLIDRVSFYFYSLCSEGSVICEKLKLLGETQETSQFYTYLAMWGKHRRQPHWISHLMMAFDIGSIKTPSSAVHLYIDSHREIAEWLKRDRDRGSLDRHDRVLRLLVGLLSESVKLGNEDEEALANWLNEVEPWKLDSRNMGQDDIGLNNHIRWLLFPMWVKMRARVSLSDGIGSGLCMATLENVFEKKWSHELANLLWEDVQETQKSQCREEILPFLDKILTVKSQESAERVGRQLELLLQESSRRDYIDALERMMSPVKSYWSGVSDQVDSLLAFVRLHFIPLKALRTEDEVEAGLKNFANNVSIYAEFPTFLGVMARLRKYRAEASDFWGRSFSLNMEKVLVNYFQGVQNHPINFGFHDKNGWQPLNSREILISFHLAIKNGLFKAMGADPEDVMALLAQDWSGQEIAYVEKTVSKMKVREQLSTWYGHIDFCRSHFEFAVKETPYRYQFESSLTSLPQALVASSNYGLPATINTSTIKEVSDSLRLDLAQKWIVVRSLHEIYKRGLGKSSDIYIREKQRRQILLNEFMGFSRQITKDFYACHYSYLDVNLMYSFKTLDYERKWLSSVHRAFHSNDQKNARSGFVFGI